MTSKRTPARLTERDEIKRMALRAARAVTVSAVVMAGCGDPDNTGQSQNNDANNNDWDLGETEQDMSSVEGDMTPMIDMPSPVVDMGSTTEDMGPAPVDMSQVDMGTVDMSSAQDMAVGEDMSSAQDMSTEEDMASEEDMAPPLMCDGAASDMVCPGFCTPQDDVDCCAALETPNKECTFTQGEGCKCELVPRCSETPDGTCPTWCTENDDADCCELSAVNDAVCTLAGGACECKVVACSDELDGVCPDSCTVGNDRDCCEGQQGLSCFYTPPPMPGEMGFCGCAVPGPFVPPRMPRLAA